MADEVTIRSGRGFKYVNADILHETGYQKITAQVVYVPDQSTGKNHHVDLLITKYSKKPSQSWEQAEVSKIIFTSDKSQSLQKLINFIKAQAGLAKYRNANLEINESQNLSKEELEFVHKVLTSFDTPEKRELLVQAKKEDVNNLYAAVKHAKNKKAAQELDVLMSDSTKESELQAWIKENTWVFGVEYIQFLDVSKIGLHSDSDFIVESLDGYCDLIELKKCDFKLFNYDSSHKCFYPTSELSQVLGQSIHYLKVMEDSRLLLKEEDDLNVLKPRIKVVIGNSSAMSAKEIEALRLLNDSLHNIEVITYNEIKVRANRLIDHFSSIS